MKRIIPLLFLILLLAACQEEKINFNKDPRILRGRWTGEILPTVKSNSYTLLGVDTSGSTLFVVQDYQPETDNRLLWLRASDGEVIRESTINLPYGLIFAVRPDGSLWFEVFRTNQPPALYIYAPDGTQQPLWDVDPVRLSGDGTRLMVQESPTRYAIYEVNTRQKLREFAVPENFSYDNFGNHPPRLDAISPDLQSVASSKVVRYGLGMQVEIYLYDLDLNRKYTLVADRVGPFGSGPFGIPSLSFSPDGSRLIGWLPDGRIRTWRASDGAELLEEFIAQTPGTLVAMSADARHRIYLHIDEGSKYRKYTFYWWEAGRGFYSQQSVQDIWRTTYFSVVSDTQTIWLSSTSGLFAQYGPEGAIWRKEPQKIPIQLNLDASWQNEHKYSFAGTATVGDKNYTLTGQASVEYARLVQALPPPWTHFSALLEDDQGNKRYMVGKQGDGGKLYYKLAYSAEEMLEDSGCFDCLPGPTASVWIGEFERP